MQVMKSAFFVFVLSCAVFSVPVWGVEITPSNVVWPSSGGDLFSFDFIISNPMGVSAQAFQTTISVSGPGTLTFDDANSMIVDTVADYWVFGNSAGVTVIDLGGNSYQFGDGPDDGVAQLLATDDIMARYAFTWDGTVGDYTFTLDFDTTNSFVQNELFVNEALQFTPGQYDGDSSSFTVNIPEPATLMFLGLGGLMLLKKRRA